MWQSEQLRAPYALRDIELTEPLAPIRLTAGEGGAHVLVRHRGRPVGRIWLSRSQHGAEISPETLRLLIAHDLKDPLAAVVTRDALLGDQALAPLPTPALTVAICTRNRPDFLRRCLDALVRLRDTRAHLGPPLDILVVDNAPSDDLTRQASADFPGVRYAMEPVPGLNFGRNRALSATRRPWLAYIDDDAVVDPFWLDRLAEGVTASPEAGCFTGPILPLMLDTEAQLRFERAGGFGKGFGWERFGPARWDNLSYPAGGHVFGTGAGMVFATRALEAIGGFDEALDTGPPLPGGGDLDAFYRIVRAGFRLIYLPGLIVHHEHRRDMPGLRKQYYSWGLSVMALVRKSALTDPTIQARQRLFILDWIRKKLRVLLRALIGRGPHPPHLVLAEIGGAIAGYLGAYQRSQTRVAQRKREYRK